MFVSGRVIPSHHLSYELAFPGWEIAEKLEVPYIGFVNSSHLTFNVFQYQRFWHRISIWKMSLPAAQCIMPTKTHNAQWESNLA